MKIARFVDLPACKSIFSHRSTFVLRSAEHYRRQETDRGDAEELRVIEVDGGSAEMNSFALSCWTILDGDEPTEDEWKMFPDCAVAIISTPEKVTAYLTTAFEIQPRTSRDSAVGRRHPFSYILHGEVLYADAVPGPITFDNIVAKTVFTKRKRFENQKEYRFALPFNLEPHAIDTYVFTKQPDYMEKCFASPEIRRFPKEKATQLLRIIGEASADYGHFHRKKLDEIIANADDLFPDSV